MPRIPKVIVCIVSEAEEFEGEGRMEAFGDDEAVALIRSALGAA